MRGEARCTVLFCVSADEFSPSEWARGSGFRWIATLGGGVFSICMPACREGEHTEPFYCDCAVQFSRAGRPYFRGRSTVGGGTFGGYMSVEREGNRATLFSFALPPMDFHGAGWKGGAVFGGLRPSAAAAFLVCGCQRVGRASVLNVFFCICAFKFSRTRGWCFREISTIGGIGFNYYILAGREGKRAAPFVFTLPPFNFHGGGATGYGFAVDRYPRRWRFWYMHVRVSGGRVTELCFKCLRRSIFPDQGAVFSGDPYNRQRRFCWLHASGTAGKAHCTVFFLRFHR